MNATRLLLIRHVACIPFIAIVLFAKLAQADDSGSEFFEKKIRPVLVEHCYQCHSAESKELQGELRLDVKAGWQLGGESGKPAVVPGKPEESLLIRAVRHDGDASAMPPNKPRLSDQIVADLTEWVRLGAPDPREGTVTRDTDARWETEYQRRLDWWSLRPVADVAPPEVKEASWARNEVDRFILSALRSKGLPPAPEADRRVLVRRLSYALTGLPPGQELVDRFCEDLSPNAYESLVQSLLASPQFGERWARHWMDVMHYSDSHGYEWDVPAKNAWRYRDYLVRAFNADVPFQRLVLEHIAGDLIEPRVDAATGLNESLNGPMAMRFGERRHGDNAGVEGTAQEAVANVIDTLGKGFLGTTVACAQCHDHKFDAVAQRDYYALAGVLMSTRWVTRSLEAVDPNAAVIEELRQIKREIRDEISTAWLGSKNSLIARIQAIPADKKDDPAFPESLEAFWRRSLKKPVTPDEFDKERKRRAAENAAHLTLVVDFTQEASPGGWRWDGLGMQHGLVGDGEIVVADEGEFQAATPSNALLAKILPAGRWSQVWSERLGGAVRSPLFDSSAPSTLSIGFAGGRGVALQPIVDHALFPEDRLLFPNQPLHGWLTVTTGGFKTLEGSVDRVARRVYVELATKSLNNNFPPRAGLSVPHADISDERSWFGVTRVFQHPPGKPPLDELTRYAPLFSAAEEKGEGQAPSSPAQGDWATRMANLLHAAMERWSRNQCTTEDALLLDEALQSKLLPNDFSLSPKLKQLVEKYRLVEKNLKPERTIGSMADWHEGRNERLGIRGSYTDLGEEVPRGTLGFLGGPDGRLVPLSSGRLELARSIASDQNPLTARVFVNRIWLHLFGEGLVRTPDDFGHLGQPPSHPELLDHLATRFIEDGWSLKKLVAMLVTTATWRQNSVPNRGSLEIDAENRLWHHMPMRRLDAESIRDSMLAVSGRLDSNLYGPSIDPFRTARDDTKRLFPGPLDGNGRRSVYTKVTLMEPPRFLALFNQPIPRLTTGRRDVTNVPDQALALLNDPFVLAMATHWSERVIKDGARSPEQRGEHMFKIAFGRPPTPEETARVVQLAERIAALRGEQRDNIVNCQPAWQDVAHALFNCKEFIYVQ